MIQRSLFILASFSLLTACPASDPEGPEAPADAGVVAECGDNAIEGNEECDDGNRRNGDGCSSRCRIEEGPVCGDGNAEEGEECDDGNTRSGDGCSEDCSVEGDGNDSYETATDLTINRGFNGVVDPAGDVDFYRFDGTEGTWVTIYTEANPDDNDAMLNTVVTLYDSEQVQLAENDNVSDGEADSQFYMSLPYTGTYYLKLQDRSTWSMNQNPRGQPSFTYRVVVATMNLEAEQVNTDPETGNDEATATDLGWTSGGSAWILGSLTDSQDVDVFAFEVLEPAEGEDLQGHFEAEVLRAGVSGNGSTTNVGRLWITDENVSETTARIRYSNSVNSIEPALPPGRHLLWINHPGRDSAVNVPPGANDFYVIKLSLRSDNVPEAEEEANNEIATAEVVTLEERSNGRRSGFVLAQLPDGDVDHYRIDLTDAEGKISVACRSRLAGSGIRSLKAELYNADGSNRIAQDTEGSEMVYINNAVVEGGATYIVKLSKAGQEADVSGHWARCGLHVRPE